jgi:hypothetical protein
MLALCRAASEEEPTAARAVARWAEWRQACIRASAKSERRFRRRAYERARELALAALVMRAHTLAPTPAAGERRTALLRRRASRSSVRPRRAGRPLQRERDRLRGNRL